MNCIQLAQYSYADMPYK